MIIYKNIINVSKEMGTGLTTLLIVGRRFYHVISTIKSCQYLSNFQLKPITIVFFTLKYVFSQQVVD